MSDIFTLDDIFALDDEISTPEVDTDEGLELGSPDIFTLDDVFALDVPAEDEAVPEDEALYLTEQAGSPVKPWRNKPGATPDELDSSLEVLGKFAQNIPTAFKGQGGGLAQYVGTAQKGFSGDKLRTFLGLDVVDTAFSYGTDAVNSLFNIDLGKEGKRLSAEARETLEKNQPDMEHGSFDYYMYSSLTAGVNMIPSVLTTAITKNPALGLSLMGTQVFADTYAEDTAKGFSRDKATNHALFNTFSETITEMPVFNLFKEGGRFVMRVGKGAAMEAVQEPVNEALQMMYEAGILDEEMTAETVWRRLKDAAIIGGLVGGGMSAVSQPFVGDRPAPPPDTEDTDTLKAELDAHQAEISGEALPEGTQQDFFDSPDEMVKMNLGQKQPTELTPEEGELIVDLNQRDLFDAADKPPETPPPPPPASAGAVIKAPTKVQTEPEVTAVAEEVVEPEAAVEEMSGPELTAELKALGVEKIPRHIASRREILLKERAKAEGQAPITPDVVEDAAHEAATSPKNDLSLPTDAQKEAGNYKKGRITINAVPVAIENPAGSKRQPAWPALKDHYGDIKQTTGAEGEVGEGVDVFINAQKNADIEGNEVYVVDQFNKDGTFDEHKVVFGAKSATHAKKIYNRNYEKGWTGGKAVTEFTWDEFKAWVAKDNSKPAAAPITPKKKSKKAAPIQPDIVEYDETDSNMPDVKEGEVTEEDMWPTNIREMRSPEAIKDTYNRRVTALHKPGAKKSKYDAVPMVKSAPVLGLIGEGDFAVVLQEDHSISQKNHVEMSAADWRKVPDWLQDPIAIFKRPDGSLKVIPRGAKNGQLISIGIRPGQDSVHTVVTAYGHTGKVPMESYIRDNQLKYINTQYAKMLNDKMGYHLPVTPTEVNNSGNKVKTQRQLTKGVAPTLIREQRKQKRTSDVGHKRVQKTGNYVGGPDWIHSSAGMGKLRRILKQLATEGTAGRYWYENSSKAILDMVNGDKHEAEMFVSLVAIYSPNATVPANTTMALTAYYQHKAGKTINAGLSKNDEKATELLRRGQPWQGIKTNSFYFNLMIEIDPSKVATDTATMDMWMAIAFDYGSKKLDQGPKYRFAEREIQRLAKELGWKPHQVQAAIWTAMKSRVDPIAKQYKAAEFKKGIRENYRNAKGKKLNRVVKGREYDHFKLVYKMGMAQKADVAAIEEAKYDFSNALGDRAAQLSWEAQPGETSGELPGLVDATIEQKFEYLNAIQDTLTGKNGEDLIAKAVGLKTPPQIEGLSAWEGVVGAGMQEFIPVPSSLRETTEEERAAGFPKEARFVKASARKMLDMYGALRGFVLHQDAVVWHLPIYEDAKIRHNGLEIEIGRPIHKAEMETLYQALYDEFGTWDIAPGYTPTGLRVLHFIDNLSNKDFNARIRKVIANLPGTWGDGVVTLRGYRSDGNYLYNSWESNPNGQDYRSYFLSGRPDISRQAAALRARVEAVNKAFDKKYGWGNPTGKQGSRPSVVREQRLEVNTDGRVELSHWSESPTLTTIDPQYSGTGIAGAEQKRHANDPKNWVKRIYYGLKGYVKEPDLGTNQYNLTIDPAELYDFVNDPDGLVVRLPSGMADLNKYEKAIAEAGYTGYFINNDGARVAAVFKPLSIREQRRPMWRSALLDQIAALNQPSAPAAQWKAMIQKLQQKGVKQEEIQWTGVMEWLDEQPTHEPDTIQTLGDNEMEDLFVGNYTTTPGAKRNITQADLMEYLAVNGVQLNEKINSRTPSPDEEGFRGTQYASYQMAGEKTGYTELLLTLPGDKRYDSSHWIGDANVVTHIRFNERTIDGKKTLFVEEIQSDWHQEGRSKGYRKEVAPKYSEEDKFNVRMAAVSVVQEHELFGFDRAMPALRAFRHEGRNSWKLAWDTSDLSTEEIAKIDAWIDMREELTSAPTEGVPNAPFKDSKVWGMVGMKRAMRWAVDNGFEQIAWTPGEVQNNRYSLDSQVSRIYLNPVWNIDNKGDGARTFAHGDLVVTDMEGRDIFAEDVQGESGIADVIGKEAAKKLLAKGALSERQYHEAKFISDDVTRETLTLQGDGLKIGGEGMKGFYDKILPSAVNKFIKKFGAKVGVTKADLATGQRATEAEFVGDEITQDVWSFPVTDKMKNAVGQGTVMFQSGAAPTAAPAATQQHIKSLQTEIDTLDLAMPVEVLASKEELSWASEVSEENMAVYAEFPDGSFKIYVFADKVSTPEEAIVAAIHEAVGHKGVRMAVEKLYGKGMFDKFLDNLFFQQRKWIAKNNKAGFMRVKYDLTSAEQRREATEEFIAYTAQNLIGKKGARIPEWMTQLMVMLKRGLRAMGVPVKHWGRAELLKLLSEANTLARNVPSQQRTSRTGAPTLVREQRRQGPGALQGLSPFRQSAANQLDKIRFYIQDKNIEMIRRQNSYGAAVPESQDVYQAVSIYDSVTGERLNNFDEERTQVLLDQVAASGLTVEQAGEWLVARHAAEANAYLYEINPAMGIDPGRLKMSGMSNQEAQIILNHHANNAELQLVGGTIDLINRESVNQMVTDHVLTQEMADNWFRRYQHYVPLQREEAEADNFLPGRGEGFSIKGRESQQRTGSAYWTPTNIITNTLEQAQLRIIRGEKHRVNLALLEQVEAHPDPTFWKIETDPTHRGVVQRKTKTGIVREVKDIPDFQLSPNQLGVKRDGKLIIIEFTIGNERAERMVSGLKNLEVPQFGTVMRYAASITRFLSHVNTSWNPEFTVGNFFRDYQTAAYNLTSTELKNMKFKVLKDVPLAMIGITKGMMGNTTAPWAQTWHEFVKSGGKTGWIDLHQDTKAHEKDLQRIVERINAGKPQKHLIARLFDKIDAMNTIVENGVRLSAYKHGRDIGMSESAAAALAKDLTVNFNRKGVRGPAMNALYMFYNAAIQGQVRLIRTMINSKTGRRMAYSTVVFAAVMDIVNRMQAGDDDDGQNLYDALPDHVKAHNIIIWGGAGRKEPLIKIPAPWGYNVLHALGQGIGAAYSRPDFNLQDEVGKGFFAVLDAFNPMGTGDLFQMISPTVIDPFMQIGTNKDWAGRPVKPAQFPTNTPKPFSQQYFKSASETGKDVTKWLNEVEIKSIGIKGGSEITPGTLDFSPEWFDVLVEYAAGGAGRLVSNTVNAARLISQDEPVPTSKTPFLRKVTGYDSQYGVKSRYYEWSRDIGYTKKEISAAEGTERIELRKTPEGRMVSQFSSTEKLLRKLRTQRKKAKARGDDARVDMIDERIRRKMSEFNLEYRTKVLGIED